MQSLIIYYQNKKELEKYLENFLDKHNIDKFDITYISSIKDSIGIDEIKNLKKTLFLRPIKGDKKAVIIPDAQNLTIEAQNSLLKILEEPPISTSIILLTLDTSSFLPTIISRCKIIMLEKETISNEKITEFTEIIKTLDKLTINEKLKLAQDLGKNKEEVLEWLKNLILTINFLLIDFAKKENNHELNSLALLAISAQETYQITKTTNTSPRFILENFFLM